MTSRLAADFTGWESDNEKFEAGFERVVQALRSDDEARKPVPPQNSSANRFNDLRQERCERPVGTPPEITSTLSGLRVLY